MRKLLFILAAMLLGSVGLHAENTITYEATVRLKLWGDQLLDPGATTFGPAITSHEFSNGKGTITCSGEITQIGDSAFVHCTGLTSITIPNSVTTIGDHAFDGCTGLTSITIPNSVTTIGDNAFSECTGLTSITIPNSVTTIGERAFNYCTGLPSITIPSSVTTIGNLAFHNCLGLTSVTVFWEDAQSIVSIDSNVFQGIADFSGPSGARLYVPTGTYNLYKQANVWKEFGSIMDPNACTITYTNPDRLTLDPYAFGRVIKDHMFSNGTGTIICSGDIKKIGKEAFYQCFNMSAINIPSSVITIDDFAFSRCASLTSFTIPSSVITIGGGAFSYCYSLKTIYCYAPTPPTLGTAVFTDVPQDELSVYVFDVDAYRQQWKQLKSECFKSLLPKDLEVDGINYQLFVSNGYKARVIKKNSGYTGAISIREQVTYKGVTFAVTEIAEKAFSDCSGLTSITIPDSVTTIGDSAFVHCTGLTTIVVASGNPKYDSRNCNAIIETATNTLIYGCQTTTKIPNTVTTIGANAFAGCTGLTSIDIPSSVTTIGDGAFSHCALGAVTLPVSVMQIGKRAFEYCEQLKSVKLPSNLTLIDEGTFQHTGLESVVIPVSVKRIENYAFYACPLNYVECIPETPPTLGSTNTFTKNDAAIVYVPTPEATMAYQSSDWKNYFTKICSYITYRQTSSNTVEVIDALPIDNKVEIPAMFASEGTFYKVTGIADSAFYEEDSLVSISLPPTIQYIGNNAFCECHRLKDINIEFTEDLQTIGNKAFYNNALDSIVIPESVQSLGRAAFAFNTLHYVSLPTGLKNIPDECFRNCYFGTEIIVPEGVETIGANSFRVPTNFEKVTLITLPSTLKEIKDYAFENRNELKEVICLAQDPPTLGVMNPKS